MEWVWILLISLVVIVVIGVAIKLYLNRKLKSIDGFMGVEKNDDQNGKVVGKF